MGESLLTLVEIHTFFHVIILVNISENCEREVVKDAASDWEHSILELSLRQQIIRKCFYSCTGNL